MTSEKQLVRITMFVLLIGIVFVYAVFFNVKGDTLSGQAAATLHDLIGDGTTTGTNDSVIDVNHSTVKTGDTATGSQKETISVPPAADTGTADQETSGASVSFAGLDQLFGGDKGAYMTTGMKILSGTSLYDGSIDILKILGINYQYALKDNTKGIYYVFIGDNTSYKLPSIAKQFGWKAVVIYSQNDIVNNLYFGDRVTFVNLPQYQDTKVNVFVQLGTQLRMIQDNAATYSADKKYIRMLFTGK